MPSYNLLCYAPTALYLLMATMNMYVPGGRGFLAELLLVELVEITWIQLGISVLRTRREQHGSGFVSRQRFTVAFE